jgi:hypothetical protein
MADDANVPSAVAIDDDGENTRDPADWFKFVAPISGSSVEAFDDSQQALFKSALGTSLDIGTANMVTLVEAGDGGAITVSVALVVSTDSSAAISSNLAGVSAAVTASLASSGIAVNGDIAADKVQTGTTSTTFADVFGKPQWWLPVGWRSPPEEPTAYGSYSTGVGTMAPTEQPTEQPTPEPTHMPTEHPCDDGSHSCDTETTECVRPTVRTRDDSDATAADTAADTATDTTRIVLLSRHALANSLTAHALPTDHTTHTLLTPHPTNDQGRRLDDPIGSGSGSGSGSDDTEFTCVCLEGFVTDPDSDTSCVGTNTPTFLPTLQPTNPPTEDRVAQQAALDAAVEELNAMAKLVATEDPDMDVSDVVLVVAEHIPEPEPLPETAAVSSDSGDDDNLVDIPSAVAIDDDEEISTRGPADWFKFVATIGDSSAEAFDDSQQALFKSALGTSLDIGTANMVTLVEPGDGGTITVSVALVVSTDSSAAISSNLAGVSAAVTASLASSGIAVNGDITADKVQTGTTLAYFTDIFGKPPPASYSTGSSLQMSLHTPKSETVESSSPIEGTAAIGIGAAAGLLLVVAMLVKSRRAARTPTATPAPSSATDTGTTAGVFL